MRNPTDRETPVPPKTMTIKLPTGWFYGALIVILSAWILNSFLQAMLAACVTAIASWPLYTRFAARLPRCIGRNSSSLIFTLALTIFVLAPLMFAFGALLSEAHALLSAIAVADKKGIAVPQGLENAPLIGPWLAARWQSQLASPGALLTWTQRTDAAALVPWAQSLGQFTVRHAFIIFFTVLLLFFLYQEGESLAAGFRRVLRRCLGEHADGFADLATRAVRASVNSMLVVALFDGLASGVAYAIVGVPHAAVWAAVTGLLALVPFLGYVAVGALALQLAMTVTTTPPLLALGLGCFVLFCGDKVVRPVVACNGVRLRFVWVLMGCLGGFEVLGLIGLVIGPVVLTLARELWEQRVRDLAVVDVTDSNPQVSQSA
ncbi:AI-2E family transporter [Accumulibacter sp.]|uniref:AI-2E family transporter n=1 Tax=Accumulibacter regalis TaxID=522306 RepID=C7RJ16_ACCRE|nr:AI-2E family transporter [Accumulibacter sp.]MBN8498645.1 AI-2E family transporter [Accumulibacter sp.]MBO3713530.1 AI-2E family transporter [Accumulibacter sp.]